MYHISCAYMVYITIEIPTIQPAKLEMTKA